MQGNMCFQEGENVLCCMPEGPTIYSSLEFIITKLHPVHVGRTLSHCNFINS